MSKSKTSPALVLLFAWVLTAPLAAFPAHAEPRGDRLSASRWAPASFEPSPLAMRPERLAAPHADAERVPAPTPPASHGDRAIEWMSPRVERGVQIGAAVGAGAGVVTAVVATWGEDGIGDLVEPIAWVLCGLAGAAVGGVLGGVIAAATGG